jgi:Mg2+ and Co2+ transporter CorA
VARAVHFGLAVSIEALLAGPHGEDESIDLASWKPRRLADDELLWIDATGTSDEERSRIAGALRLEGQAVDALGNDVDRPDAVIHEDAIEVRIVMPPDPLHEDPIPLRILIGKGWVVTSHQKAAPFLDERRERVSDQRELGRLSAIQFLVSLLDWQVDGFFRVADHLEAEVDKLDEAALRTDRDILGRLVAMRRQVARQRRILSPHRELYAELARPDFFAELDVEDVEAIGHLVGRLDRAAEAIGHAREMLISTFDVHMTRTAQRTNDIMRVLTIVSVVLLPSSVLAGVMGMNFKVGFFEQTALFWLVVAAIVAIAPLTLGLAKARGWI